MLPLWSVRVKRSDTEVMSYIYYCLVMSAVYLMSGLAIPRFVASLPLSLSLSLATWSAELLMWLVTELCVVGSYLSRVWTVFPVSFRLIAV